VTQPRRVAAITLATRVAAEHGTPLGSTVGYQVRFDERVSAHTRIRFLTDGMLVRALLADPLLSAYAVVVVDEAHERTLRTDLLVANLKTILKVRNAVPAGAKGKARAPPNPLKVVIMSATLDADKFSAFFDGCLLFLFFLPDHPSLTPPAARRCCTCAGASTP
jgi:ATP-dependent RNA helicase DHX33